MEYLIFFAVIAVIFVALVVREILEEKKKDRQFTEKLGSSYGEQREREYKAERFQRINSYYKKHPQEGQLDDITWNDLGMDEIFKSMNHTYSAAGEEYLYHTLRSPGKSLEELEHMEKLIHYFQSHEGARVTFQLRMHKLGYTGKYSLYDYLDNLDYLGKRSNTKTQLLNLLYLPSIAVMFFQLPLGICGFLAVLIYQILTYFREKGEIEPYIISFVYILRLLDAVKGMRALEKEEGREEIAGELKALEEDRRRLSAMERNTCWLMTGNSMSGNPLDIIADYLKMAMHLDLLQFNRMLAVLRSNTDAVDRLISVVGQLETACAIGAVRVAGGKKDGYCVPELTEWTGEGTPGLLLNEGYHPLLTSPVKNSISTRQGVLLTGSNASGKSTFLKMVAINSILAQTIHTCFAAVYRAPMFRIYSSMALRDSIEQGDSYYIAEIKALKRIFDSADREGRPVLCFVDEVLRGTNTIERVSASTQILRTLGQKKVLCFAATHDIELTEYLAADYDNYHFEENISEGDISFPYRLLPGRSNTRNAIKLLELLGFEKEIIDRAREMAESFLKEKNLGGK